MAALINGPVPSKPGPAYEILRLKAGASFEGVILSQWVWGYQTHWIKRGAKGYSVECKKGTGTCLCASQELPTRWKGYLHVFELGRAREAFLEVTTAAFWVVQEWQPDDKTLRGYQIRAQRGKGGDNSRLNVHLVNPMKFAAIDRLPGSKDPRPYLERLWALCVSNTRNNP